MLQRPISTMPPPAAERRPVTQTRHDITLTDDYAWLKAGNWQDVLREPEKLDPAIRAYLEAENAYADANLRGSETLQAQLLAEMKGRIKQDDWTVPARDATYA